MVYQVKLNQFFSSKQSGYSNILHIRYFEANSPEEIRSKFYSDYQILFKTGSLMRLKKDSPGNYNHLSTIEIEKIKIETLC